MINIQALEKMDMLMADALSKGAKVLIGGARHELGQNFFQPTLLTNINDAMRLANEEIFGPIAAVQTFTTEEGSRRQGERDRVRARRLFLHTRRRSGHARLRRPRIRHRVF